MTIPLDPYTQGIVPQSTIVPQDDALFIPYFTRTYENLAQAINAKDGSFFSIPISSTPSNIPNMFPFGAYIVCVSAENQATDGSYPPTITASLCKSSARVAGSVTVLGAQAGQGGGTWGGSTLTITSTATAFQIAHSVAGVMGAFNIRFIGTQ